MLFGAELHFRHPERLGQLDHHRFFLGQIRKESIGFSGHKFFHHLVAIFVYVKSVARSLLVVSIYIHIIYIITIHTIGAMCKPYFLDFCKLCTLFLEYGCVGRHVFLV